MRKVRAAQILSFCLGLAACDTNDPAVTVEQIMQEIAALPQRPPPPLPEVTAPFKLAADALPSPFSDRSLCAFPEDPLRELTVTATEWDSSTAVAVIRGANGNEQRVHPGDAVGLDCTTVVKIEAGTVHLHGNGSSRLVLQVQ